VSDVDLSVTKTLNRKTGKVDSTKIEETGDAPIEDALFPLFVTLTERKAFDARLLWLPPDEDRAASLLKHLRTAEIGRAALRVRFPKRPDLVHARGRRSRRALRARHKRKRDKRKTASRFRNPPLRLAPGIDLPCTKSSRPGLDAVQGRQMTVGPVHGPPLRRAAPGQ
jgi:hypothetical protein